MVEGTDGPRSATMVNKRKKKGVKKFRGGAKRMKVVPGTAKKNKINPKMQKLFRRRAREYNSDDDEDDEETVQEGIDDEMVVEGNEGGRIDDDDMEEEGGGSDEDGDDEVQTGVMKFAEGCKAFRVAFQSIMKTRTDDETLGPVLSAKKKLVVSKLAEEEAEKKAKGEAKKEKHLIEEKGHVKPENFLDTHEKFLIGIATKGVVKLFNAVNKAQNAQKGLNPSRFKDAKALTKRRKEAFHSELSRTSAPSTETARKTATHKSGEDGNQPAWAPLRDTFMLTNSKMKDWDKMAEETEI